MSFVFTKTHRVGSTTVRVLFERYADRHGLRTLKIEDHPLVPRGAEMLLPGLVEQLDGPFDISARHIAFQPDWLERLVPDATYVTILRDPLRRAVSQYHAFTRGVHDAERSFDEWYLERGATGWPEIPATPAGADEARVQIVRAVRDGFDDYYAYWLGLAPDESVTRRSLEDRFASVGVTERFDESLTDLRRQLGWDLEDVFYSSAISTGGSVGVPPRHVADTLEVSDEVRALFESRNARDYALYELANEILDERAAMGGAPFQRDVEVIRREYHDALDPADPPT